MVRYFCSGCGALVYCPSSALGEAYACPQCGRPGAVRKRRRRRAIALILTVAVVAVVAVVAFAPDRGTTTAPDGEPAAHPFPPAPLPPAPSDPALREVAGKVTPSVVVLVMRDADGAASGQGGGFVVGEGVVVTHLRVIAGASGGEARLAGDDAEHSIRGVVASDPSSDLVLLAVDGLEAAPLALADSDTVAVGDAVYAMNSLEELADEFSAGAVRSIRRVGATSILRFTASLSKGSSGGPVVDERGHVIGVVTFGGAGGLHLAAPSSRVRGMFDAVTAAHPLGEYDAADVLRGAAEQGDARAMLNLGVWYTHGKGVPQDHGEAVRWYRLAAEQGDPAAMRNLGGCYHTGKGVAQDYGEAVRWFRVAAEQGDAVAMYILGASYAFGWGVAQDDSEAVRWYRRAAEQGDARAMYSLGLRYTHGEGVAQDDGEAARWFRLAAEQGDAGAMYNLGWCYTIGKGVPQDHGEAVRWYHLAAEQGHAGAMTSLGAYYDFGAGVQQNYHEAARWFRQAAELGDAHAMYRLGVCYEWGEGVARDRGEAVRWYRRAAEQGYAGAMYNLGVAYARGMGVPEDIAEGYVWLSVAAEFGDEDRHAERLRRRIARRLTPTQRADAQRRADTLFTRLSQQRDD